MKIISLTFVCLLMVAGCQPRGETKTLEEVYDLSRERYVTSMRHKKLTPEIKSELDQLAGLIETVSLDEPTAIAAITEASTRAISDRLANLTIRAGYTSRPALGELGGQWRNAVASRPKAVKLLAARTYSLIASELNSIAFSLKERELKQ